MKIIHDDRREAYLEDKCDTSERVPGVFGEHTFEPSDQFTAMGGLESLPLNSTFKGLLMLSYTMLNDTWQIDLTTQLNGKTRLPNTSMNPVEHQLDDFSPAYALMFAQLKRTFGNLEIYAGVENLTNFRQDQPILAWDDPFSPYFDSSLIWGPTFGRRFYVGFRFH